MYHYVYILKTADGYFNKTYVGYSTDVFSRLKKHNSSKGAKATRGYKWKNLTEGRVEIVPLALPPEIID